jgi:trehalose synthase
MEDVPVSERTIETLADVIGRRRSDRLERALSDLRSRVGDRVVWHVNSTPKGGGVAEVLGSLVGFARGAGLDWRWVAIEADEDFFTVTKRIHNRLHGERGDDGPLGDVERDRYRSTLERNATDLVGRLSPGDVVFLHDPQTLGLAGALRPSVSSIVWRCHVGIDEQNDTSLTARSFLSGFLEPLDARVFSTTRHTWDDIGGDEIAIIPPAIDGTAPKNQPLDPDRVNAILHAAGISDHAPVASPSYRRPDGSTATVSRRATLIPDEPLSDGRPLLLQVSRWDRLKDPIGVLHGFADHVVERSDVDLVLAGPAHDGIEDDPEDDDVLAEVLAAREELPDRARSRTHVVTIPMEDPEENGAIVNALQRRADVIIQKSLAEGFGLTVAEAMWKSRPVIASAVGGIRDQIEDGRSGVLLDDPTDLATFGRTVVTLLEDAEGRERIRREAHERVLDLFLVGRELRQHLELIERLAA